MNQEEIFVQELSALVRLGKNQGNQVTSNQIKDAFVKSQIAEDKIDFIKEYLLKNQIKVDDSYDPEEAMTTEDKDFLSIFMEELEALPVYSDEEKEEIMKNAIEEDEVAQMKVLEIFLPKVVEIAKLYVGQNVLIEDLIGEGNVALTASVSMLSCLEKADEVEGFLAGIIMDAMEVLVSEEADIKDADERILEKVNLVATAAEELYNDLRRKVTPEELANEMGVSVDEIIEAYKFSGKQIDTIDMGEENA